MVNVKLKLIEEINKIEDESLLQQLTELVLESDQGMMVEFNQSQIEMIKESQEQIKNGESSSHEEVMKLFGDQ